MKSMRKNSNPNLSSSHLDSPNHSMFDHPQVERSQSQLNQFPGNKTPNIKMGNMNNSNIYTGINTAVHPSLQIGGKSKQEIKASPYSSSKGPIKPRVNVPNVIMIHTQADSGSSSSVQLQDSQGFGLGPGIPMRNNITKHASVRDNNPNLEMLQSIIKPPQKSIITGSALQTLANPVLINKDNNNTVSRMQNSIKHKSIHDNLKMPGIINENNYSNISPVKLNSKRIISKLDSNPSLMHFEDNRIIKLPKQYPNNSFMQGQLTNSPSRLPQNNNNNLRAELDKMPQVPNSKSVRQAGNEYRKNATPTPSSIETDINTMFSQEKSNFPRQQPKSVMGHYNDYLNQSSRPSLIEQRKLSQPPKEQSSIEQFGVRKHPNNESNIATVRQFDPSEGETPIENAHSPGFSVKRHNNKWVLSKIEDSKSHNQSPVRYSEASGIIRVDSNLRSQISATEFQHIKIEQPAPNIVESYAIKQRQGFIPGHSKPNQDSYLSHKNFAGVENLWFFGVCDGHGGNGHVISDFVKKNLPRILSTLIQDSINSSMKKNTVKKQNAQNKEPFLPPLGTKNRIINEAEDETTAHARSASMLSNALNNEELIHDYQGKFNQWLYTCTDHRDQAIREAFMQTNEKLDTMSRVDCTMSGTTTVVALIYKNIIVCANAGDSRAVMFSTSVPNHHFGSVGGSTNNVSWKATPLSRDHKPDELDEANRVRAQNGRIEQSKILPGQPYYGANNKQLMSVGVTHYGPKRVWLKTKQIPGLAMTRSLGDFVAKSVGVTCEPEIKVFANLCEQDKAVVIASDGIWDRLTNEEVSDIVKEYHGKKDPQGATHELTRVAVDRWQREHGMVDDITVVVIYLNINK